MFTIRKLQVNHEIILVSSVGCLSFFCQSEISAFQHFTVNIVKRVRSDFLQVDGTRNGRKKYRLYFWIPILCTYCIFLESNLFSNVSY